MYKLIRPAVFALKDAETAHKAAITALKKPCLWKKADCFHGLQPIQCAGLTFPGPVGLAAGFDKDAQACVALSKVGFAFIEVGTVTPLPQAGNPRPRLFRLKEDKAVINRMGFNNGGIDATIARINAQRKNIRVPVGLNVGLNKERSHCIDDYAGLIAKASAAADYVTVNISSPNTPGLRDLQQGDYFPALLSIIQDAQSAFADANGTRVPVFIKLAPDMESADIDVLCGHLLRAKPDGVIISNTTISRPEHLRSPHATEAGGLSGAPLKEKACAILKDIHTRTEGAVPLIGAGGISTADDVKERLAAGATLVQLYSAIVYEGPYLAAHIHNILRK